MLQGPSCSHAHAPSLGGGCTRYPKPTDMRQLRLSVGEGWQEAATGSCMKTTYLYLSGI